MLLVRVQQFDLALQLLVQKPLVLEVEFDLFLRASSQMSHSSDSRAPERLRSASEKSSSKEISVTLSLLTLPPYLIDQAPTFTRS
jgi:hypothetical protein